MSEVTQNPVGWFEIYVDDLDAAKRFYEAMLQVTLSPLPSPAPDMQPAMQMLAFPMATDAAGAPGAAGALVKMDMQLPPPPGRTMVYFSCADCAVTAARAAENGGSVMRDKFAIGEHGFIALARDPEGNMLGLHSTS